MSTNEGSKTSGNDQMGVADRAAMDKEFRTPTAAQAHVPEKDAGGEATQKVDGGKPLNTHELGNTVQEGQEISSGTPRRDDNANQPAAPAQQGQDGNQAPVEQQGGTPGRYNGQDQNPNQ